MLANGRYGARVCLAMNSKNRVKEDLRLVPFAHDDDFSGRVKLSVN
jgi:hypothetical protein